MRVTHTCVSLLSPQTVPRVALKVHFCALGASRHVSVLHVRAFQYCAQTCREPLNCCAGLHFAVRHPSRAGCAATLLGRGGCATPTYLRVRVAYAFPFHSMGYVGSKPMYLPVTLYGNRGVHIHGGGGPTSIDVRVTLYGGRVIHAHWGLRCRGNILRAQTCRDFFKHCGGLHLGVRSFWRTGRAPILLRRGFAVHGAACLHPFPPSASA